MSASWFYKPGNWGTHTASLWTRKCRRASKQKMRNLDLSQLSDCKAHVLLVQASSLHLLVSDRPHLPNISQTSNFWGKMSSVLLVILSETSLRSFTVHKLNRWAVLWCQFLLTSRSLQLNSQQCLCLKEVLLQVAFGCSQASVYTDPPGTWQEALVWELETQRLML